MTLTQVWGSLLIFLLCPLLGALPLTGWATYYLTGCKLSQVGTGNVSVSAAFYHGGKIAGIVAVCLEAAKGIAAVLLARAFFPTAPAWELIALIALIMGRYWRGKGAGTTNVVWGIVAHDFWAAFLIFLVGSISFTIFRDRATGRLVSLILLALMIALRHPSEPQRIVAAIALSVVLGWIFAKIPDDLDLSTRQANPESRKMFKFFRGDQALISLDSSLDAQKVGQKAATLSQLKRWGYGVPDGWVLPAGDDAQPLILSLTPSPDEPFVVRSSAVGEDSETASAAGQYITVLNITRSEDLEDAITRCQTSYNNRNAVQYRRDRHQEDASMAVLVQKQIRGVFSGVAFSRDPVEQYSNAVAIEALPGDATQVVSGQITPERYRVFLPEDSSDSPEETIIEGSGDIPPNIIQAVAVVARELEARDRGIPQDIEWTHDGQQLWILQARPITTLRPIWTRKIAAEVIPGLIRPLTWSINQPLTCGVWGDLFTLVLGGRARDLDFTQTATLHYSHAYFNATLLGSIFLRMGLPPESLEFLTRGEKFSRPPASVTLRNLPGLMKLFGREWNLAKEFQTDYRERFAPVLQQLEQYPPSHLPATVLGERIERILLFLRQATFYSILASLSLALRQGILQVKDSYLDSCQLPEIESTRSLARLAAETRKLLPMNRLDFDSSASLFAYLADSPDGESAIAQFNQWLERYGYLSQVATDIAVPRWRENPRPMRELFAQCLFNDQYRAAIEEKPQKPRGIRADIVQQRLNLKGKVTEVYSRLLAHLRWSFVALEQLWLESGILEETGDIFYLQMDEIQQLIEETNPELSATLLQRIHQRRRQLETHSRLPSVPFIVYGNTPTYSPIPSASPSSSQQRLRGIAVSPGQIEGRIKILRGLDDIGAVDKDTILVVPYTDSGWAPLLARAGGLIAEVGGRLSHGAIIAREYGIPAVTDVRNATQLLKEGQRARIDGYSGIVEIL
ncbi:glycerol-3-phosphate acyltransferase [Lusitaniella coriacea]|uniref:glycerol-3-phosphate acyltransferase n=1 Tax=Lusitaniella coriacea TaxID=1983105 RepID=UPI003CEA0AD5